jgi:2-keto-4-pentenoate hydratase/2-oxohepta-3-ene-1,7-dioic acid hydratase in catechol pathway
LKLARYSLNGKVFNGLVAGEKVHELSDVAAPLLNFQSVDSMKTSGEGIPLDKVRLLSPVETPEKILCVAVNYRSHATEQAEKAPEEPYFFTKFRNALIGDGDSVIIPKFSKKADWEVELSVIIGKKGRNIAKKDAFDYIAGYSISNDVSFRDLQMPASWTGSSPFGQNWVKGKGLDTSFPLGPWIVTKEDIPDPGNLQLSLSVNGKIKQNASTGDMVNGIDRLVEYASLGVTLKPGDIISTGTPAGVALFTGEPFLKDGDVMEAKIESIGTLRNPVVAEQ